MDRDPLGRMDCCRRAPLQTSGSALGGKGSVVVAGVAVEDIAGGVLLDHTLAVDMVDPALHDAVMQSHCDLLQLRVVCIAAIRLPGPFSPLSPSVLHMVVSEVAGLEDLVVFGEAEEELDVRCDIHATDQSLVCEGLDGRTANVLRVDDDQADMVQVVERREFGSDPDDVGTAGAAAH